MVGGEDHDGVVRHARGIQRVQDAADRLIDQLVQVVVQAPVGDVGRLLGDHLRPQRLERLLARRAPCERVALRRCLGDVGHGVVGRVEAQQELVEATGEGDVVRVHERRHREPRSLTGCTRQVTEEVDDLFGEHAVADGAAVVLGRSVGLAPDPAREPERIEPVGRPVGLDGLGDHPAVVVGGGQARVASGDREVGMADVPLAAVVGLVAAGAEPVAERRHGVGVQPPHPGVVAALRHTVGLRDAVQRRVLTGEEGGPTGHTGRGADVVPVELDSAVADPVPGRQLFPAEPGDLGRLVGRRVALLVGHDDQDVRLGHDRNVLRCPPV